jgi:sugar phosphate isomerase/epimerase
MHPRVTVSEFSFPPAETLEIHLATMRDLGAMGIGLSGPKVAETGVERVGDLVRAGGQRVAYLVHPLLFHLDRPGEWDLDQAAIEVTLDAAEALGARRVYGTTGSAGKLTWADAATAFEGASPPVLAAARERGVELMVEANNPQFADLGFVHSAGDLFDVCRRAGYGVCLDLHACWTDRGLEALIDAEVGRIGLVQVADYVPGTRTLDRDAVGAGVIPLERHLAALLEGGYTGSFDIECYSTRADGHRERMARSIDELTAILDRLGA